MFWPEFGSFLKEGVCQDYQFQEPLAKLLMFESSKNKKGELTTLEEYVGRCPPEQKDIYYLCAPSRELAESSPYVREIASERASKASANRRRCTLAPPLR